MSISIQYEDFDPGVETAALSCGLPSVGAVATFVGLVRGDGGGEEQERVTAMTLEHYPGMTEKSLREITGLARERWDVQTVRVIHRVGRLKAGERIVYVGVGSSHRHDAFAACEFIMDFLKTRAPFWKCEETPQGSRWVDARDSDDSAAARWDEGNQGR